MAVIRGANAPLILRTITEQLAQEHKVLDGQAERKEVSTDIIIIIIIIISVLEPVFLYQGLG